MPPGSPSCGVAAPGAAPAGPSGLTRTRGPGGSMAAPDAAAGHPTSRTSSVLSSRGAQR